MFRKTEILTGETPPFWTMADQLDRTGLEKEPKLPKTTLCVSGCLCTHKCLPKQQPPNQH